MTTTIIRKRSPHGVESKKPIALRLMPEEREQAEVLSTQIGLSKATFAREAYLVGAPLVVAAHKQAESESKEKKRV